MIYTIGHSTHPIDEFLEILHAYSIRKLVDIRTIPRSAHNPQFEQTNLEPALKDGKIAYLHMPALGGLRHTARESPNTGWRNKSFRGFADYMQTPQFQQAIDELIDIGKKAPVAIMCAEAVPWRCHRSLISDAAVAKGVAVFHIMDAGADEHRLTSFGRIDTGGRVHYDAAPQSDLFGADVL